MKNLFLIFRNCCTPKTNLYAVIAVSSLLVYGLQQFCVQQCTVLQCIVLERLTVFVLYTVGKQNSMLVKGG